MPMFFHFIETEYIRDLRFQNLTSSENTETPVKSTEKVSRNLTKKMLINCLKLFSKFQNPAVLYRERELKIFVTDVLSSPDGALQTAAVDFLAAYKKGTVQKYKNLFSDLVRDDAFRNTFKKIMSKQDDLEARVIKMTRVYGLKKF